MLRTWASTAEVTASLPPMINTWGAGLRVPLSRLSSASTAGGRPCDDASNSGAEYAWASVEAVRASGNASPDATTTASEPNGNPCCEMLTAVSYLESPASRLMLGKNSFPTVVPSPFRK